MSMDVNWKVMSMNEANESEMYIPNKLQLVMSFFSGEGVDGAAMLEVLTKAHEDLKKAYNCVLDTYHELPKVGGENVFMVN